MNDKIAALQKRLDQLKTARSTVQDVWRECYRYSYPLRGALFESGNLSTTESTTTSSAGYWKSNLFDSTATDAVRVLAAALVSGTTPANSRWFGMEVEDGDFAAKQWLDEAADVVWRLIHASNFDAVAFESALDLSVSGQFVMFVDRGQDGQALNFEQWPLAGCFFSSSRPEGIVDTVFREFEITIGQAAATYGEEMLSEASRKKLRDGKADDKLRVALAIYPRTDYVPGGRMARNLPFASCHYEIEAKKLLRESGYREFPVLVPRWMKLPGSPYAFGPMFEALPDVKTLNEVVRYVMQNAELAIAGMWGARDDGVLQPRQVKIGPRKIVVMRDKDSMWPLSPATKFDVAAIEIDRLQRSIRKVLMADQLTPQEGPAMTATEIMVRVELIRQQLGPVYGRLQSEFLSPLVLRAFSLVFRSGREEPGPVYLPDPPRSLLQSIVNVRFSSPIARSQKMADVQAMDRFENTLAAQAGATGRMDLLDMYDFDRANRRRAELLNVPLDVVRDERAVLDLQKQRQGEQQRQQAMAAVANTGEDGAQLAAAAQLSGVM